MMHPIERLRYIARAYDDEPAAALASEAAYTLAELSRYEPSAVLTACRRLLEAHPSCGPLWWVGANLAAAGDALEAGRHAGAELCSDPTADRLAAALRSSVAGGDVVVLGVPVDLALEGLHRSKPYRLRVLGEAFDLRRAIRALAVSGESGDVVGYSGGDEDEAVTGASVVLVEVLAAGAAGCLVDPSAVYLVDAARAAGVPVWALAGVGRALPAPMFEAAVERSTLDPDRPVAAVVGLDAFSLAICPDGTARPQSLAVAFTCPPGLELLRKVV